MTLPERVDRQMFLVTTRVGDDGRWHVDITNEREIGLSFGPFGVARAGDDPQTRYIKRIERHLLINWYSWYMLIEGANVMAFDEATRQLTLDCMTRTQSQEDHDRWMKNHPLPPANVVPLNEQGVSESFQSLMDSLIQPPVDDNE